MIKNLWFIILAVSYTAIAQKKVDLKFSYENTTSLISYLEQNKVPYDLKDLGALFTMNDFVYINNNNLLRVPKVFFFNAEGNRIVQEFSASSCAQTLKNIEKVSKGKVDTNDNINKWLTLIDFPFTKEEIFADNYDLYVIIFYAKWADNSLEEANEPAFNWYKSIKELNSSVKIKPILVSLDVMENWQMTEEQKKGLGLK